MTTVADDIQHIYNTYNKDASHYQELQADKEKNKASKWKLFNNLKKKPSE